MRFLTALLVLLTFAVTTFATSPQRLQLKNQFGETSLNYNIGKYLPLNSATFNQVVVNVGSTITPTAATLVGVAGTGSLYLSNNPASYGSAKLWMNIGTITAPAWSKIGP